MRNQTPVYFRMYFTIRFNRPIDKDRDYISPGGYELVMNGKTWKFDMMDSYMSIDDKDPCLLRVEQRNPDFEAFNNLKRLTYKDMHRPEGIEEFFIYTDTEGPEADDFLCPVQLTELYFQTGEADDYNVIDWQDCLPFTDPEWEPAEPIKKEVDVYAILQLKDDPEYALERFANLKELQRQGKSPDPAHYETVYVGYLPFYDGLDQYLESLFAAFNSDDRPEDFAGHSMSVSDIIMIRKDGKESYHFVDSIGFTELPDFKYKSEKENELITDDGIKSVIYRLYDEFMATGAWCGHAYGFEVMKEYYDPLVVYLDKSGMDTTQVKAAYQEVVKKYNALADDKNKSFLREEDTAPLQRADDIFLQILAHTAQLAADKSGITDICFENDDESTGYPVYFTFELYRSDKTGQKMIFISANDNATGAEYPFDTAEDIGKAITFYLNNYYPDSVNHKH